MRRLFLLLALPSAVAAQAPGASVSRGAVRGQPYAAYETLDSLGRTIRFYVSDARGDGPSPLVVYVHGSGHQSHFQRRDGRVVPANGHATLTDRAGTRARVLIVEKPGVTLYERGDTTPSQAFREEHTLERWVLAVRAAVLAARRLPGIDTTRLLVIGHSEGGIAAAAVAARMPVVTHVALLAAGGPSQLFDLELLARRGLFFNDVSPDSAARVAWLRAQWDSIGHDPGSATRDFFGHPFRRWSSFLRTSTIAEIGRSRAATFVAQGADDKVVTRESFDSLVVALRRAGRMPVVRLMDHADHSFMVRATEGATDGWPVILGEILEWYLK